MLIVDKLPLEGSRRRTADGYLVAQGKAARIGVQDYLGSELGRPDLQTVRVYRPEDEVFGRDSASSFANKPITLGHPPTGVTADNWRQYAVGHTGSDVMRDGDHVSISLLFTDAAAIARLDAGVAELSGGYSVDLDWTSGRSPAGEAFDAVQRKIRINHIALVERGRAGSTVRVGDAAAGAKTMNIQDTLQNHASPEVRLKIAHAKSSMQTGDAMQIQSALANLNGLRSQIGFGRLTADAAAADQVGTYLEALVDEGHRKLAAL